MPRQHAKRRVTREIGGPYLTGALICERALQEKDNVASLIRILDRVIVRLPKELPHGEQPVFPVTLFLAFRSGDFTGTKLLTVTKGKETRLLSLPIVFEGQDQGPMVVAVLPFPADSTQHWLAVRLDEKLMTKIPLRVEVSSP